MQTPSNPKSLPGAKAVTQAPGSFNTDRLFFFVVLLSFLLHSFFAVMVRQVDIKKIPEATIEDIPQRYVRMIMDKPRVIEKKRVLDKSLAAETAAKAEEAAASKDKDTPQGKVSAKRVAAQKNVAQRAARVGNTLRTTGMLALLTGKGPTRSMARGAVDVMEGASFKGADLDAALKGVTGVQRGVSAADMEIKLSTRRVTSSDKVSIEDYVSGFGKKEKTLDKLGSIEITKPKTVGAAANAANRDDKVISQYVKDNMRSIKAAYDRVLKSKPELSGKITVRFTILPSGKVGDVEIADSTIDDAELLDRIIKVVRNWRFPVIPDTEGDVTVNFPFLFQPK